MIISAEVFNLTNGKSHYTEWFESAEHFIEKMPRSPSYTKPPYFVWIYRNPVSYQDDDIEALKNLFQFLVDHHDLYYMYSDDHRVWTSGRKSLERIKRIEERLPEDFVKRVWEERQNSNK